ncbi:EamA family transporter [Amycolatopsis sp. EV170708-02-1]|uniref:EamA family transporter n=1 Tax=Amycolatopsis sp. EV170708-02-1 TaxID=2919322 RepID=UPI001F0C9742|nr:EamA family transporter [Amycolatopsis sp. EV170708-02-1]UMO99998.1 EamA family transporter [Amycolatopsis sp. EV170708-02-1]
MIGFAHKVPASAQPLSASTPKVLAALLALWLCWGSSFPAIRVMVTTLPPLLASGAVFLTAGLLLAAVRPRYLRGLEFRSSCRTAGVGVCLLGAQGTIAVAEQHVFASTAALLAAAVPLWVIVLRLVTGDPPTAAGAGRLLLGFTGVSAVLLAGSGGVGDWTPWNLAILGAAVSWAAGTLWASRSQDLPPPGPSTIVQLLSGGAALLMLGAATGEGAAFTVRAVDTTSWIALAYLVFVDSVAGFALYNWLLRSAPVTIVSTYAYAVPIVAYIVGIVVLAEPFHFIVLLGAALIVAAVAGEVTSAASR